MDFNTSQLASALRTVLIALGGGTVVAAGYMDLEVWTQIASAIAVFLIGAWGWWAKTNNNLVVAAASVPDVQAIVAPGMSAADDPEQPKVVDTAGQASALPRAPYPTR